MNFRVGQKVVCIADKWEHRDWFACCPMAGRVYTVRGKFLSPWAKYPVGLYLHEIANPEVQFTDAFAEPAWDAGSFRPIVERKIELPECLTALLDPAKHKQFEDAR